jgi:hypothetical protein
MHAVHSERRLITRHRFSLISLRLEILFVARQVQIGYE